MGIKNYTTKISAEKTIGEIESILAEHSVTAIYKEYNPNGSISALSFKITVDGNPVAFRLPMRLDAIWQILKNEKANGELSHISKADVFDSPNHARRVGWRIIKDWIDAQMALVEINMVKMCEVFLPYAYDGKETMYEKLERRKFDLQLNEPKVDRIIDVEPDEEDQNKVK